MLAYVHRKRRFIFNVNSGKNIGSPVDRLNSVCEMAPFIG